MDFSIQNIDGIFVILEVGEITAPNFSKSTKDVVGGMKMELPQSPAP